MTKSTINNGSGADKPSAAMQAANTVLLEALQQQLMAVALQGLMREGKEAALVHLARIEAGSASLQFVATMAGNDLQLVASYCSEGTCTPMISATLTGPKACAH